jgi:PAS domain-containing protein/ABC-type amino acid transport substrate-binding protein/anti-sigma regulatory factor (Ser/Thr protein kinase)
MTRKLYILIVVCLLSVCHIPSAQALYIREYSEERPLIIVSDWEFPPYEFRNDRGEPDGYNVEVLDLILNHLKIPHKYVMKEWYKCTEAFENREADLIHALTFKYQQRPYVMTQNMITYYNVRAARLKKTPPLESLDQLTEEDTLVLKKNDYVALRINEIPDRKFGVEYHSSREALVGLHTGKYKYYAWGEVPLQAKLKEYGVEDVALDDFGMSSGELRIIGYDKELIDAIDDMFARLEQSGEIVQIRDKWFHPERVHNDTSPVTLIILIGVIVAGIIAFLLSQLIRTRVKNAISRSVDLNRMMTQALNMGNFAIIEYDIERNHLRNLHGNILPEKGMKPQEFIHRMKPTKDRELHENNLLLARGEESTFEMTLSLNVGSFDEPEWKEIYGNALVEKVNGRPRYIIYTVKDITQEVIQERQNREIGSKYQKIFESNLIAMSFYDKEGFLIAANKRMRRLSEFNDDVEKYFRSMSLFDTPYLEGQVNANMNPDDEFYVCQRMFYPDLGIHKYIELKIRPTFNDAGELRFFIATCRDLSAERQMYLRQRNHEREIQKANDTIEAYEQQLRYLLENSKMFIWSFNPRENIISFTQTKRKEEFRETLDDFFEGVGEENIREALNKVKDAVATRQPYNSLHYFEYTPIQKHPVWYAISGIPKLDKDGRLMKYFGIARNITDLMEAQRKLKEETRRADDSAKMKSAFLANMTHEIRTPLNAIVGFSDLLPVVDTNEERMEFIRIIRNNCDMLMRLINDILEASNMGQALAIKTQQVEFSQVFDDICQTLAQRVQEPGVEFIKDNPYPSFPATTDIGRVQQVLTNFVTNAVKYTHEGHIRVGYREQDEGIYFYCEDTGAGIPKDKQSSVFERFVKLNDFVQGTGLGLSICQAIAERMGGKIGVNSEGDGHGSTFWFWTPRNITTPTSN